MPGVSGVFAFGCGWSWWADGGPRTLGVFVCICGGGVLVLVCLCGLVDTRVSWQGWRSDFLRLTDAHRVLPNFLLLFFIVPYSVFLYISCNIVEFV